MSKGPSLQICSVATTQMVLAFLHGIPSKSRQMQVGPAGLIRDVNLNESQTPSGDGGVCAEVPTSVQEKPLDPQPESLYREGRPGWGTALACRS